MIFFTLLIATVLGIVRAGSLGNNDDILVYEYPAPKGQTIEDLMECINKYGWEPRIDNVRYIKGKGYGYPPEDIAEWYLHQQVLRSTRKTNDPHKANIFIVNTSPMLSSMAGECNGKSHEQRSEEWARIIQNSEAFKKYPGDHAFICQSYRCNEIVDDSLKPLVQKMIYLIHEKNEEWIGIENYPLENVVVVPYVAHSDIRPFNTLPRTPAHREHMVTFFGSLLRRSGYRERLEDTKGVYVNGAGINTVFMEPEEDREKFNIYGDIMQRSTFCLIIGGDTPSSRRLFDAMLAGCLPVFIGLNYRRPFGTDVIPYGQFSFSADIHMWYNKENESYPQEVIDSLYAVSEDEIYEKRHKMAEYLKYIDWRHGEYVLEAIVNEILLKRRGDKNFFRKNLR